MSKPKIIKYNYRKTYLELYGAKNVCCDTAHCNTSGKVIASQISSQHLRI